MIKWWNTNLGIEAKKKVNYALDKSFISQGPLTKELEKKISIFLKAKNIIAVPNGSQGMLLALLSFNLKINDEIIVPNVAWISLMNSIKILNLKPILVEVEKNRPVMCMSDLKKKITKKTKVIIPVHMNGRITNMIKINEIAKKHRIKVIEDAAQSFGVKYRNNFMGTFGDIGVFSMSMSKTITSGQGGFLIVKRKKLANKIIKMRNQGAENVNKIYKWKNFGFNFKLTDLQSAIAITQLQKFIKNKKILISNYLYYKKLLLGMEKYIYPANIDIKKGEIPTYNEFICKKRLNLLNYLFKNGIETREFYPNFNKVEYIKFKKSRFLNSEIYEKNSLYLPSGPDLKKKEIQKVVKYIRKFYEGNKK